MGAMLQITIGEQRYRAHGALLRRSRMTCSDLPQWPNERQWSLHHAWVKRDSPFISPR